MTRGKPPARWHKGIGRALAEACVVYARARGATKTKSQSHSDNEASIRFHEALDFVCTGAFVASDGNRKVGFSLNLEDG
jgi:L-amino acid N-acyltransferase YncA